MMILQNKNMDKCPLPHWKWIRGKSSTAFEEYDQKNVCAEIVMDPWIMSELRNCINPYSLICKLQKYDSSKKDGRLYTVTQPVIVIPGGNAEAISAWEKEYTIHEKEIGIFPVRFNKKISQKEYLAA